MIGLATAASLALRFPKAADLLQRFWKPALGAGVAIAAVVGFLVWKDRVEDKAYDRGFAAAQKQFNASQAKANKVVQADNDAVVVIYQTSNTKAVKRDAEVKLAVKPRTERIEREVAANPVYRTCAVSDSVLDDLQAGRRAINEAVAASNPR